MKRITCLVLTLVLCIGLMSLTASAAEPTASLTGSTTVRPGDTIHLTLALDGRDIIAITGNLVFDSNQLSYVGFEPIIGGSWDVIMENNSNLLLEDTKQSNPINSKTNLLKLTFLVKDVEPGSTIQVAFENLFATTLEQEYSVPNATYSANVLEPLSGDNTLKTLSISNATLSPAFNPNVFTYTTEVPFEVSQLDISALTNDSKATMTLSNPTLSAGTISTVTITVKAENGSTKVYTIKVRREKDPNYVPSSNNDLSGIKVDGFLLSPVFDSQRQNYLIWLPYETDKVYVSGTPADPRATVQVEGGKDLVAGADNEIRLVVTAEDGSQKVYTVVAKRAAPHDADPTIPSNPTESQPPETNPPETDPPASSNSPSSSANNTRPTNSTDDSDSNVGLVLTILYCVIGVIALGGIVFCVFFILSLKRKGKFTK